MRIALLLTACLLALPAVAQPEEDPNCSFSRGTNVCAYETQRSETSTIQMFSGCVAGPTGQPGRRVTTYEDTYLVTTTTTTYQHGRNGKVYDSNTTEERQFMSRHLVSSVCEPL